MSIKEMKTLTIGDVTYKIMDENATHYAVVDNPDRHSEYFIIMDDGAVALKPEYRGASTKTAYPYSISDMGSGIAGSKNAELPKHIIVPEIVDGKAVCSLATAIFCGNLAVESVALPYTITEIPERCFDGCNKLKNIYGAESIEAIGKAAFQSTAIERLKFPALKQIDGIGAFYKCGRMVYADVGDVSILPSKTFEQCTRLNMIKKSSNITSVGENCFALTPNLKYADFISRLTNIGNAAFLCSGIDYDWNLLDGCVFGNDATPLQYNPIDFWSSCVTTACENELPTFLSQNDARWTNRAIGNTGKTYSGGCLLMCAMHIYCGLHNISLSSVIEFENIVNEINPNLLNTFTQKSNDVKSFVEGLGLTVERYTTYDQTVLQTLYDALAAGKYAMISLAGQSIGLQHVVVAYGVDENGNILLADSIARDKNNESEPVKYSLPYHKLTASNYNDEYILHIISL